MIKGKVGKLICSRCGAVQYPDLRFNMDCDACLNLMRMRSRLLIPNQRIPWPMRKKKGGDSYGA
jgi:hypothetical protein